MNEKFSLLCAVQVYTFRRTGAAHGKRLIWPGFSRRTCQRTCPRSFFTFQYIICNDCSVSLLTDKPLAYPLYKNVCFSGLVLRFCYRFMVSWLLFCRSLFSFTPSESLNKDERTPFCSKIPSVDQLRPYFMTFLHSRLSLALVVM